MASSARSGHSTSFPSPCRGIGIDTGLNGARGTTNTEGEALQFGGSVPQRSAGGEGLLYSMRDCPLGSFELERALFGRDEQDVERHG